MENKEQDKEMSLRTLLIEQSMKTTQELEELKAKNGEKIESFLTKFITDGFPKDKTFIITASDIKLLHDGIHSLLKIKEDAQITAMVCDIQSKELQKLLFSIASNELI